MSYTNYRSNLQIIGENKLVSIIDENQLGIDDRYFNYYRTSYSVDQIINIVDKSFRALFLNLDLKVKQGVENTEDEIEFIKAGFESFHYFAINNFVGESDKERITELIKEYSTLLEKIKENPYSCNEPDLDVRSISDKNDSRCVSPLLMEEGNYDFVEEESPFNVRVRRAKRILNQCLNSTKNVFSCMLRRIKHGWNFVVNRFIESYRR